MVSKQDNGLSIYRRSRAEMHTRREGTGRLSKEGRAASQKPGRDPPETS